ncbi:MAG: DUF2934 domain-containing protein [Candidatus Omnitrophica bacterium]|nr:DUF2934 domain-containing protein [Candidatus Omnitrophota bacterium]
MATKLIRRIKDTTRPRNSKIASSSDSSDRIQTRAYYIWLEEGMPQGRDLEFWYRAEQEVRCNR